jgi:SpoVK/Ycf46/Vps4 family AAA+-type ATPase
MVKKINSIGITCCANLTVDLLKFKESKEWYYDRGIPYRRGYLLYGPPGTGKTSFIRSLASHIKMNVAMLNLSTIANDDALSTTIANIPKNSIVVLEDIDHYKFEEGVTETKKKKSSKSKESTSASSVSVSGILNAIDGIASLEELGKVELFFL